MCSLPGRLSIRKKTQNKLFCQPIHSDELALGMKRWLKVNFISLKNIYRQKPDFLRMCSGADPLHIRKNTHTSKFLLSQAFIWKENMFFVIPEMSSKTFVMV